MYETHYHRAASVKEAVKLLASAEDAKPVSGGQTLIATMKQRLASPANLVDLRHIADLKGITIDGSTITIGAGTTHAEVAGHAGLKKACAGLAGLAAHIGDPHVRHMGTIGGNKRKVAADAFFTGLFDTALKEGEIITAVSFEKPVKAAYAKFPNPASRYALAGVFVAKHKDSVRVAITGAGSDGVFRHKGMEKALSAKFSPESVADVKIESKGLLGDIHASPEYRAALIKAMAKRAVMAA
jgi:aerobic carbon-monoxide dehydrogenase medium subunit